MGYGEFGGNGSVIWQVNHGDGEHGGGNSGRCTGKDREPRRGTQGRFRVYVNGVEMANVDLDTSRILIVWGNTTLTDIPDADRNVPMREPASTI